MRNPFKVRLPGWATSNISNQPLLLSNQTNANDNSYLPKQSTKALPEALIYRTHSTTSITQVILYDLTLDTFEATVTDQDYISIYTIDSPNDSSTSIDVIMLRSKAYSSMTNGHEYQYRVTDSGSKVYYTESWVASDVTCDPLIRFDFSSTCFFNNIDYAGSDGWAHSILLQAQLTRPEFVNRLEVTTNNNDEREITSQKKYAVYRIQAKMTVDELAAISTADGHESLTCTIIGNAAPYSTANVKELSVVNVDYNFDELSPIVTLSVRIEEGAFNNDCCEEIECPTKTLADAAASLVDSSGAPTYTIRVSTTSIDDIGGWVEVQWSSDDATWLDVGNQYTYAQITGGIDIDFVLSSSTTYYFRYLSKNWNCEDASASDSITTP